MSYPPTTPIQNPATSKIERAMLNLQHITPKDAEFIRSLQRRGPDYSLSQKQWGWLNGIMVKIDKATAGEMPPLRR